MRQPENSVYPQFWGMNELMLWAALCDLSIASFLFSQAAILHRVSHYSPCLALDASSLCPY